jgi:arabinose-5-phosphate isomerase
LLDASIEREACPLNLAPTTSVIVAMALGDALAMSLQKRSGFGERDYALNHPGGRLGRRLTLRVRDVMRSGDNELPLVGPDTPLLDVLYALSAGHVGAVCVAVDGGKLLGIIAESDLRGALQEHRGEAFALSAAAIMNAEPAVVLQPTQLAYQALQQMENRPRPISVAPVAEEGGGVVGIVHVHDLVRAGL